MVVTRAPDVYVPIEPDNDGTVMPTLLSVVVHGAILGLVLLTHKVPESPVPPSIETSIITPEELAGIQAGIRANQQAVAAASAGNEGDASTTSSDASPTHVPVTPDMVAAERSIGSMIRQSVPVFMRSDAPPEEYSSEFEANVQNGYDPDYLKFQEQLENFNKSQETEAEKKLREDFETKARAQAAQAQKLNELKDKEDNPTPVEKPQAPQVSERFDPPSRATGKGAGANAGSGESLTWTADEVGDEGRSSSSGGGSNLGAIKAKIMGQFQAPYNTQGQSTTLNIRVSARGDVLTVSASGGSQSLQDAATSAARRASPLPIDANDPTVYPSFTMQFNGR